MPSQQLTNVAGADAEGYSSGPVIQDVYNADTIALPVGTLVSVQTIVQATTTQFAVKQATTSAAQTNIGIVVSGTSPGTSIAVGGTGSIVIHGHCRALLDSTTTPTVAGHTIKLGATAGSLSDNGSATPLAVGLNYGVVLEVVTIASGTALVNIWFQRY